MTAISDPRLALGGAWLAAQGHQDARAASIAALELGFGAVLPAPSARLFPWQDLRRRTEDLPLAVPAIRVDPPFEIVDGSLASSRGDDVLTVRGRVERACALGRTIGCNTLILEAPVIAADGAGGVSESEVALVEGRDPDADLRARAADQLDAQIDAALERSCRNLHALLRDFPDFEFCLTEASGLLSLSRVDDLEAILEDLASSGRLGYWHRPAVSWWHGASGGVDFGTRLERLSRFLRGMDVADYGEHGPRSVPGSGYVDYGLLAPYMRSSSVDLTLCLEPAPSARVGDVRQGRVFLSKYVH